MACKTGFIIAISRHCWPHPPYGARRRRTRWHLADAGRRRPGPGQQMRRRHLRRHRRLEAADRSRHRQAAGRRQESQSGAGKAPDDRAAAVQRHAAAGPGKWSGQIYNADDGGTYVSNVSSRDRTRCGSKAAWARSAAARPGPASGTERLSLGRHRLQRGRRRGIAAAGAVDEMHVVAAHHRRREAGHHRRVLPVQAIAHDAV